VSARTRAHYLAGRAYHRGRIAAGRLRGGRSWHGVRILGYHRVAEGRDALCVSPADFAAQMQAVARLDAEPIRLDAALDLLARPVAGRYVAVTFDDGYHDNLTAGVPILERHGIPATIFVPSAIIDGARPFGWYRDPPRALSWDEIRDLVGGGLVDVQAHTRTHPLLPGVDDAQADDEIAGCKRDIEAQVGYELTSFCYPAGLYGERELALVRAAGYRAAVTTAPGVNGGGAPPETLRRTLVFRGDSERDFEAKLSGLLDHCGPFQRWLHRRRSRPPA
jgi:peptidoglycan/xylan/chitin deacetylase (PgdA/CDA1 family)